MRNCRHDQTGRSTGRTRDRRAEKLDRIPEGDQWFWLSKTMVESPAWQAMTDRALKMFLRICIEHMHHAGTENGRLKVTFDDFVKAGVRRQDIRATEAELIALGFIEKTYPGRRGWGIAKGEPAQFRLSHLSVRTAENIDYATNAFKRHKTVEDALAAVAVAAVTEKRRPSGKYLDSSAVLDSFDKSAKPAVSLEKSSKSVAVVVHGTSRQKCRNGTGKESKTALGKNSSDEAAA